MIIRLDTDVQNLKYWKLLDRRWIQRSNLVTMVSWTVFDNVVHSNFVTKGEDLEDDYLERDLKFFSQLDLTGLKS